MIKQLRIICFLISYTSCHQRFVREGELKGFLAKIKGLTIDVETTKKNFPPKGIPFKDIPGPKDKTSRIGIVGAGPAGIDMAYRLKTEGFTNVEVLEKSNRIGGRSKSLFYRNVTQTFSTYVINPDYNDTVTPLLQEFGLLNVSRFEPYFRKGNNSTSLITPHAQVILMLTDQLTLAAEAKLYTDKHRSLFGAYEGELMPRPQPEVMKELQGTMLDFLTANKFPNITTWLSTIVATEGYNNLANLSAIYGLLWVTPRFLLGTLGARVDILSDTTEKPGQFQALFGEMVKKQNIGVTFNYDVDLITKNPDGTIKVSSFEDNTVPKTFDFLIWTGLLPEFAKTSKIVSDPVQKILMSSFHLHQSSSLVNMETDTRKHPIEIYELQANAPYSSQVCRSVDYFAEAKEIDDNPETNTTQYSTRSYMINGEPPTMRTIGVLTFGDRSPPPPEGVLQDRIRKFFAEGFNATKIQIIQTVPFVFLPQWSIEDTAKGYHWDLFEAQGQQNIWFTGAGVSWDTVKSVMEYNKLLLRQSKILTSTSVDPKATTTPAPAAAAGGANDAANDDPKNEAKGEPEDGAKGGSKGGGKSGSNDRAEGGANDGGKDGSNDRSEDGKDGSNDRSEGGKDGAKDIFKDSKDSAKDGSEDNGKDDGKDGAKDEGKDGAKDKSNGGSKDESKDGANDNFPPFPSFPELDSNEDGMAGEPKDGAKESSNNMRSGANNKNYGANNRNSGANNKNSGANNRNSGANNKNSGANNNNSGVSNKRSGAKNKGSGGAKDSSKDGKDGSGDAAANSVKNDFKDKINDFNNGVTVKDESGVVLWKL